MIGVKGKQLCANYYLESINALWPWPLDPKITRVHHWLIGSLLVKFHDDRCKGKAIMRHKPFPIINALWPWPFDPNINRAHHRLMGSLFVKFHDDRCKGKAVVLDSCYHTLFFKLSMHWDLDLWTRKSIWHIIDSTFVKFHDDRCKGKVVMRTETFYLTARLQTDRVIPVYPPPWKGFDIHCDFLIARLFLQKQYRKVTVTLA